MEGKEVGMMKAKTYLKQIELMDAKINTRLEEVERLNALATKTTSVMGGERVQSSGSQQKMENCILKLAEAKDRYEMEVARFLVYKQNVLQIMDKHCDPDCINLLYSRYFQYKPWEQIAVELNYTYKWVSGGLHQRALSQVQKGLDEREKRNERSEEVCNMPQIIHCGKG